MHTSVDSLSDIIVLFVSKGWCKYCSLISPNLNSIQNYNKDKMSFVVLNQSFIEKPYQEEGFKIFMKDKDLLNMNYNPESELELKSFRLFLRDHCIEFPALFVFSRKTGELITNDGYNAFNSVFNLKQEFKEHEGYTVASQETFRSTVLKRWEQKVYPIQALAKL
jgi:hypothetical protein